MKSTDEAIVLAGGFGTRLQSVVKDVPKPLAPVAGLPFVTYLLDLLVEQGVRRIVLATGYMADVVERTLGSHWQGVPLVYSVEHTPLGTGGAMALAMQQLTGDAFFVLNGDTFVDLNYADFDTVAAESSSSICVALADVPDVHRYGAVKTQGSRIVGFSEKGGTGPGQINAGVYRITRDLSVDFGASPSFSFEQDVLLPQTARGRVAAYAQTRGFIDIGVPEDYERAQKLLGQLHV